MDLKQLNYKMSTLKNLNFVTHAVSQILIFYKEVQQVAEQLIVPQAVTLIVIFKSPTSCWIIFKQLITKMLHTDEQNCQHCCQNLKNVIVAQAARQFDCLFSMVQLMQAPLAQLQWYNAQSIGSNKLLIQFCRHCRQNWTVEENHLSDIVFFRYIEELQTVSVELRLGHSHHETLRGLLK